MMIVAAAHSDSSPANKSISIQALGIEAAKQFNGN
jgi:hypothetical protein